MRKSYVLTAVWVILILGWLVLHCKGIGGRPLTIMWVDDPGDYDPQHTSHPIACEVFRHVCEPLFYVDAGGRLHGILAEEAILYSADGQQITITVKPGITFHDGTPLDAEAIQASFERLQRLGTSPLLNDLRDVRIAAHPDGRRVTFTLPYPNYEFTRLTLANGYAGIIASPESGWQSPGFVSCTGPYQFAPTLYIPGKRITLVPHPRYNHTPAYAHQPGITSIHRLTFRFEPDREARLHALAKGQTCVLSLSHGQTAGLAAQPQFKLYTAAGGLTYLGFNFQRARWQDRHARQAIAQAIDKTALAADGPFEVAHTPLTPNTLGYTPHITDFGSTFDPEHSRSWFMHSAFDSDSEIIVLIPESNTYRELALTIQQQLAQVGLHHVRIREIPRADILNTRQDFDLLLFDYAWSDYAALSIFLGPGPRNLLNYPYNDIHELIMQTRATEDATQQEQLIMDAQRIILEETIIQPLLIRKITFAVNQNCVVGAQQTPFGELIFWNATTNP